MSTTADPLAGVWWRDVFDPGHWPAVEPETHLISGLLSTSLTVLAAEPAVGKTHLAVGMAGALLNGDPAFLGRDLTRGLDSVAFLCTDADGAASVRRRIAPLVQSPSRGRVLAFDYPGSGVCRWEDVVGSVAELGPGLLVVDNVMGVVEDVNDAGEAKRVTGPLVDLTRRGTAVLMLTHTSKPGPRGPAQGVNAATGSRYWSVPARCKATMTYRERDHRRLLSVASNDGERVSVDAFLDVVGDAPVWSVGSFTPSGASVVQAAAPSTGEWAALAHRVVTDQPPGVASLRALGHHYAEGTGRSADTIRQSLSKRVAYADGRWSPIT